MNNIMYAVIQFVESDGGGLAVVVNKWLTPRKQEVHWPPLKDTKAFDKILQKGDASPESNWRLYKIQRVFYETDNIDKAKKKLKLAEVTSDLQTEEDESIPKRRKVPPKRYISSSSSDEDESFPRPPQLKQFEKYANDSFAIEKISQDLQITESVAKGCATLEHTTSTDANDIFAIETISQDLQITESIAKGCSILEHTTSTDANDIFTIKTIAAEEFSVPISIREHTYRNPTTTGFQEKVISLLSTIKVQNELILGLLKEKQISVKLSLDLKFPITHIEDVDDIETKLQQPEKFDNLILYLKTLGGRELHSKISRILKYLLSDHVAANFNFYGKRSQKRAFNSLQLCKCVVEALKSTSNSTEKEIEDFIKTWLKHAPGREKIRLQKLQSQL